MKQKTCSERIDTELEHEIENLTTLWQAYTNAGDVCPLCEDEDDPDPNCPICEGSGEVDKDGYTADLGNLYEYGLCFDYVAPETFDDRDEGYFRYQISTGGPGDEFRFFANKRSAYDWTVYRVEYWFLDWFDGAKRILSGTDLGLLKDIFEWFASAGSVDHVYTEALDL